MIIKYENLAEDLLKIPFIKNKIEESDEFRSEWDRVVVKNIFTKETAGESYKYTKEESDLIYERFQTQFEMFGYDKDSWMYL